jgi:methionyl-tRNA formyltransferase
MDVDRYGITVISDEESWINRFLPEMIRILGTQGHRVSWVHSVPEIGHGDFAFILGFGQIVPEHVLGRNRHNLVVHESGLPQGKGWSPLSWQILEGKRSIPITLFEAQASVDCGDIYLQDTLEFAGHELVGELRALQARKTIELCLRFVDQYPAYAAVKRPQTGRSSQYPRRSPVDSKLDPDKSIREQMNLLRIVDNDLYPAFFEIDGIRYRLRIEKE